MLSVSKIASRVTGRTPRVTGRAARLAKSLVDAAEYLAGEGKVAIKPLCDRVAQVHNESFETRFGAVSNGVRECFEEYVRLNRREADHVLECVREMLKATAQLVTSGESHFTRDVRHNLRMAVRLARVVKSSGKVPTPEELAMHLVDIVRKEREVFHQRFGITEMFERSLKSISSAIPRNSMP